MSVETGVKINNLVIELGKMRVIEKEISDLIKKDDTTLATIRRAEADFKHKMGQFEDSFLSFIREEGVPEKCHLLDVIHHFWKKAQGTLVIPQ